LKRMAEKTVSRGKRQRIKKKIDAITKEENPEAEVKPSMTEQLLTTSQGVTKPKEAAPKKIKERASTKQEAK